MSSRATTQKVPKSHRPALSVLQKDQRALLTDIENPRYDDDRRLRPGFADLRGAIHWYQRATVRTFGKVADQWEPTDLLVDDALVAALVTGHKRKELTSHSLDPSIAREYRWMLESEVVLPACTHAFNELRQGATEYIEREQVRGEKDDLEPESQEHVAMRPTFEYADHLQDQALRVLWGGFESRQALFDWVHDLNEASNGAISPELAGQIDNDRQALNCLLNEHDEPEFARRYRESVAIRVLLPAFADGISRMSAGELASVRRTPMEPTPV